MRNAWEMYEIQPPKKACKQGCIKFWRSRFYIVRVGGQFCHGWGKVAGWFCHGWGRVAGQDPEGEGDFHRQPAAFDNPVQGIVGLGLGVRRGVWMSMQHTRRECERSMVNSMLTSKVYGVSWSVLLWFSVTCVGKFKTKEKKNLTLNGCS